MLRFGRTTTLSLLSAFVVVVAFGCGGGASSPKDLVAMVNDAAAKKDAKALAQCMADPWGAAMLKMLEASEKTEGSKKKLAEAVDKKYGAGAAKECGLEADKDSMPMPKKSELIEVKEEGDKAKGKIKEEGKDKPEDVEFVKQGGSWKMLPEPGAKPEEAKMFEDMAAKMPKMAEAMEALAKDVDGGKYATKMEFQMAYGTKMAEAMK